MISPEFNDALQLLATVAQFGDNSTETGPRSIVNIRTMQEFKFQRFLDTQKANKQVSFALPFYRYEHVLITHMKLEYHIGRLLLSYGEASFTLNFFADGELQK